MTDLADAGTAAPAGGAVGSDEAGDHAAAPAARVPWWRRPIVVGAACLAVLAIPLAVALGVLHSPRWYPLLDLAQAEMRVRDVGTRHPTLVGAAGRIEAFGVRGSHPGPLAYWALRPVYTLMGETAFGLQVATASLNLAAMAVVLWIANRRGGVRLILALAALLAVLTHLYGAATLTEAWNPYFPLLWWLVFLLAAWSVLCDDMALLPLAAFAGSFCLQAHNSYLGLVGGVAAALAVVLAARLWRRRDDRADRRRVLGWTAATLAVGFVVWLPPIVEQVRNSPGNLSIVLEHLRHPTEGPIGAGRGLELLGVHLNVWRFADGQPGTSGSSLPALALVAVWLASVAVAWRAKAGPALMRLHALLGLVLVLSAVSVSRIFGEVWFYLALWAWGTTALMVLAIGWSVLAALSRRPDPGPEGAPPYHRAGAAVLAGVLVVWTVLFAVDAAHVDVPAADQSAVLAGLAPGTVAALTADGAPGGGKAGHYLVTWTDPVAMGGPAQGLLLELERHGLDANALPPNEVALRSHRIIRQQDATAEVHMAVGNDIEHWRNDRPDAREVAYVDRRSAAQRARYERLRTELTGALADAGMSTEDIDDRLVNIAFDPAGTPEVKRLVNQMATIGQPAAVFVTEEVTGA
jgi:hypothetical protein